VIARRRLLAVFALVPALRASSPPRSLRGTLAAGKLLLPDGTSVTLSGDDETEKVLADERLQDADFEVLGRADGPGRFRIEPIHIPALFVYRGGRKLRVTYWCDVCYIRTYAPGLCWCCRKETLLDPREPEE
jgi:hypothetical protein